MYKDFFLKVIRVIAIDMIYELPRRSIWADFFVYTINHYALSAHRA